MSLVVNWNTTDGLIANCIKAICKIIKNLIK